MPSKAFNAVSGISIETKVTVTSHAGHVRRNSLWVSYLILLYARMEEYIRHVCTCHYMVYYALPCYLVSASCSQSKISHIFILDHGVGSPEVCKTDG